VINKLFISILSLFIITACGGGGGSSPSASTNTDSTQTVTDSTPTVTDSTPTVLEGSWKKSCGAVDPADPDSLYDEVTLTFAGNGFTSDIKNFTNSLCTTPLPMYPNPKAAGNFVIGNQITTTGGLNATELDSHITSFNGAPFDENDYTIFVIENDILLLGDDDDFLDGSTAQLRSDTIDTNRQFIRQ
jgi:hypothetical protein